VKLENRQYEMKRNLLVLPAELPLRKLKVKDLPPDVDYIFAKKGKENGKLYPIKTVLHALLQKDNGHFILANLKGNLHYQFLKSDQSLLDLQCLEADYVVALDGSSNPISVIDCAFERKKLHMYSEIIENFQEEIFVTDNRGKILLVNPRSAQILGLKVSELKGRMVEDLVKEKIISSSGAMAVLKQRKKVDILQFLKEGRKWHLCTGVPVFNHKNELIFTICISKDVTELVETKKKLEAKEDELKRKDSELSIMQEELFAQVNFISVSAQMRDIKETIKKIAPQNLTVLIQGETGVGKEVVARAIHALSPRRKAAFVKINCASFPDTLISSELFGYEGGAFTGAKKQGRIGKIELAHGGTLFLDEIGEISHDLQVKLLEFLQDMEFFRIGGTKRIKVDTRIIVATNRDLQEEVRQGRFRKDLFYRLNLISIKIPPLRERREDIPALINYYLDLYNRKYNKNVAINNQLVKELTIYPWPGNVRELEHVLERLVVIYGDEIETRESFPELLADAEPRKERVYCPEIIPYKQAKHELEHQLVEKAYNLYGSTYKAADALGIAQSTVARILKRMKKGGN